MAELMVPTVGLNVNAPRVQGVSIDPTVQGQANANLSQNTKELRNFADTLFKLASYKQEVQNRADILSNVNELRDAYNKRMIAFTSLKGKDAINGKDQLVKDLQNIRREITQRLKDAQPIVQQRFKENGDQLDITTGANIESYVMQESVAYRNNELMSTISLDANDAISMYGTAQFKNSMNKLNATTQEYFDANGIDPDSEQAKSFKLKNTSLIHFSAIGNYINLDQLGKARQALNQYKPELTAEDYNKLNARLFDAQRMLNARAEAKKSSDMDFLNALALDKVPPIMVNAWINDKASEYLKQGFEENKAYELARSDLYALRSEVKKYSKVSYLEFTDIANNVMQGYANGYLKAGTDALGILNFVYGQENGTAKYYELLNDPYFGEKRLNQLTNLVSDLDRGNAGVLTSVKNIDPNKFIAEVEQAGGIMIYGADLGLNRTQLKDLSDYYNRVSGESNYRNISSISLGSVKATISDRLGALSKNEQTYLDGLTVPLIDKVSKDAMAMYKDGDNFNNVVTQAIIKNTSAINSVVQQVKNFSDFVDTTDGIIDLFDDYSEVKVNTAIMEFAQNYNRYPTVEELEDYLKANP